MTSNHNANHLIMEKSPYLQQHAYNPVTWYPWGEEAFTKAKNENKPIFLSIGYSTCHWCHVFAHESFEDTEIAAYLNEHFIAIKVDREERPDIDAVYMKVCQMMTGHGGWPLSIFMTPEKVPFYAGTYFPRKSKYGMPGFMEVLEQLHNEYTSDPEHIEKVTGSVTDALHQAKVQRGQHKLSNKNTVQAYQLLESRYDAVHGGFGAAPKFPAPQNLLFLLRFYQAVGKKDALRMVRKTLDSMKNGGIYDHVGYGFARYATDKEWLVPHFEKMLYDNALLATTYTECYTLTKKDQYKQTAEEIISFLLRDMKHPDGGYYAAIDADSEGVEGKYYVWDYDEIIQILGDELGRLYTSAYNITLSGNFEGKNIPNQIGIDLGNIAKENNLTIDELTEKLEVARKQLLTMRTKRIHPHIDDKILLAWNAMVVTSLAKAGAAFQNEQYITIAEENVHFLEETFTNDGRLMARCRDGEVKYNGYLDDYAYLLQAYIELYGATFKPTYLQKAKQLADQMISLFWDKEDGGFFFTGSDSEVLLSREKEVYDGAMPSGNSVAAITLASLGYLTGNTMYLDKVTSMYYAFYEEATYNVAGCSHLMQSLLLTDVAAKEVIIVGDDTILKEKLRQAFTPHTLVVSIDDPKELEDIVSLTSEYTKIDNKTTYYVCENFQCQSPTNDPEKAWKLIQK